MYLEIGFINNCNEQVNENNIHEEKISVREDMTKYFIRFYVNEKIKIS